MQNDELQFEKSSDGSVFVERVNNRELRRQQEEALYLATREENKDQAVFDPFLEAQKVPKTHTMTRDQTDTFERRGYKNDNKDWPPVKDAFIGEPKAIEARTEPRVE